MDAFKGIDLNDSFVLSWHKSEQSLSFNLEASIWPESPHYSSPEKEEWTCYKPAILQIDSYSEISGLKSMQDTQRTSDANNEVDFGNIDDFVQSDSGFKIVGDFGVVQVTGGRLKFAVET